MKKKTQECFELDVLKLYGDRYDISESKYVDSKTKLLVKCNLCGKYFNIRPNDLLSGHGCNCNRLKKNTGFEYKQKFLEIHGDKYDYSNVDDKKLYGIDDCIVIVCKKHGTFKQKIKYHLKGHGCRKCSNEEFGYNKRLKQNEVNNRLDRICGNALSYEMLCYKNYHTKIKFICNKSNHVFYRTLNGIINNNTCPYCNGREDYSSDWFIQKAKEIYGDKYDYSKVNYINTDTKVTVICHEKDKFGNEHGEFQVTPHAHIGRMKSGCPKCSRKHRYTTDEFINESNYIHNNFYDYSKTIYNGATKHVIITCPIHGDFKQKPNAHLSGQGCPHCKTSHVENEIAKLLDNNSISFVRQYKPEWLIARKTSKQALDFYLPDYNVAIEVQGDQHFKPVKYWGGDEMYKKVVERDKRKFDLCNKNNVHLLYYTESKNIPQEYLSNLITDKNILLDKILKLLKK